MCQSLRWSENIAFLPPFLFQDLCHLESLAFDPSLSLFSLIEKLVFLMPSTLSSDVDIRHIDNANLYVFTGQQSHVSNAWFLFGYPIVI